MPDTPSETPAFDFSKLSIAELENVGKELVKSLYAVLSTVEWSNVQTAKAVATTMHRIDAGVEVCRKAFDENVWAGHASGKFTPAEVPSIRAKSTRGSTAEKSLDEKLFGASKV